MTFNGQMSTLKDNAMSFLGDLTIGLSDVAKNEALPFLNEQMQMLKDAFAEGGFDGLFESFGEVLGNLSEKLVEALPDIVQFGSDLVIAIMEGMASSSDVIATAAGDLIRILGQAFIDFVPLLFEIAGSLLMGLVQGISDNAVMLANGAAAIMISLANSITALLPTLIPLAVQTIITIIKALIDNIPMLVEASIAMVDALADGILDALPLIVDAVPEIILSLIDAIIENLPKILESGAEIIVALATGLIKAIPQLLAAVPDIFIALVKAFGALTPKMWQVGKDIVGGIWKGIESAWSTLVDNLTRAVGGLVKSVKKMLGINSPSTVMKEIFVNFVAGGDVGLDQEFPDFEKKVTKQYGGLFSGIRAESAVTPAAAVAGGNNVLQLITPVQIDGREVARTTAEYTGQQLSWLQ